MARERLFVFPKRFDNQRFVVIGQRFCLRWNFVNLLNDAFRALFARYLDSLARSRNFFGFGLLIFF